MKQVLFEGTEDHPQLRIRIERRGGRRHPCRGCGRRTWRVRDAKDRTWDDVPWETYRVTLVYRQRRVGCQTCGIRTERIGFADPKARVTRRLRQLIGLDFRTYVLREQLDRLWTYKKRTGVLNFLLGGFKALRWQRLPEMEHLGDFLLTHINGIAAYCDHAVRFGVVESVNATIKGVIRRARGMRDESFLLLKLKRATARPIRSARDYMRFLSAEPLHSNR
ncbi:MAG: transposase [Acidobacteriota bacterium]